MFINLINQRKWTIFFLMGGLLIGAGLNSGCSRQAEVAVNIPKLAGKSPEEVEKVIGKPTGCQEFTNKYQRVPGNYCEYKTENTAPLVSPSGLTIRFNNNQAKNFVVDLKYPTDSEKEALTAVGIDAKDNPATFSNPTAATWRGKLNGISFTDLIVLKQGPDRKKFTTISADIE